MNKIFFHNVTEKMRTRISQRDQRHLSATLDKLLTRLPNKTRNPAHRNQKPQMTTRMTQSRKRQKERMDLLQLLKRKRPKRKHQSRRMGLHPQVESRLLHHGPGLRVRSLWGQGWAVGRPVQQALRGWIGTKMPGTRTGRRWGNNTWRGGTDQNLD